MSKAHNMGGVGIPVYVRTDANDVSLSSVSRYGCIHTKLVISQRDKMATCALLIHSDTNSGVVMMEDSYGESIGCVMDKNALRAMYEVLKAHLDE